VLKIKQRLSTAFHPQTDGQTERCNQVLEQYLRSFVTDEKQWARCLKTAEFAVNNAINDTIKLSPNEALMGYRPDFAVDEVVDNQEGVPEARNRISRLQEQRRELEQRWRNAQETQAKQYNKAHQPLTLQRGDLVLLSTKNLRLKSPNKLTPKFIGPFRVLQSVGSQAYRLSLPRQYSQLHNVFHVNLLEPWTECSGGRDTAESMPMPDLEDAEDEWEVETILAEKRKHQQPHFLIKWKGWPAIYNEWLAEEDMEGSKEKIHEFRTSKLQLSRSRRSVPIKDLKNKRKGVSSRDSEAAPKRQRNHSQPSSGRAPKASRHSSRASSFSSPLSTSKRASHKAVLATDQAA
jgi:hypothetical protein